MFENVIALFDRYYTEMDSSEAPGFSRALGCELRKRLTQLDFIIERVGALENQHREASARFQADFDRHARAAHEGLSDQLPPLTRFTKQEWKIRQDTKFEMELLSESFYYLAGRARTIIKHKDKPLPGLTRFECAGVRNTRNKLLEHPESSDSGVHTLSFGWGTPRGPIIKAIRLSSQTDIFPDNGLYENAVEFRDNLERAIQTALRGP